jgi:hypothetical protein
MEPFNVIFFDDDLSNFTLSDTNEHFIFTDIHIKPNYEALQELDYKYKKYLDVQIDLGNKHASYIKDNYIDMSSYTNPHYFGLQYSHIDILEQWIVNNSNKSNNAVFFDWDNTLSVCPYLVLYDDEKHNFDMLLYYLGGYKRTNAIIRIIKKLFDNNFLVYILTRNGNANRDPNRTLFIKLLQNINNKFNDTNLIYTYGHQDKKNKIIQELTPKIRIGGSNKRNKRKTRRRLRRYKKRKSKRKK